MSEEPYNNSIEAYDDMQDYINKLENVLKLALNELEDWNAGFEASEAQLEIYKVLGEKNHG